MTTTDGTSREPHSAPDGAQKLRFGIMCRGLIFPAWQAAVIRDLVASGAAEPVLLIADDEEAERPGEARSFRTLLYRLYQRCWGFRRLKALRPVDLTGEIGDLPSMRSRTLRYYARASSFRSEDVAELRRHRLDFILQFAFPRLTGDILTASRYGVWAYYWHPEDCHGTLTAFWAYLRRRPALPRTLFRLTAAQPERLHHGSYRASASWTRSLDAALFGSTDWCARVCRQILLESEQGRARFPLVAAPPERSRLPGNGDVLYFLTRRAVTLLPAMLRRCFLLEYWNIGIADAAIERVVAAGSPTSVRWLGSPRSLHYHADPFALPEQPGSILFEEYSHLSGSGWISAISLTEQNPSPRPIALFNRGTHRSYPFLFSVDGTTYCVPESAADRRVDLYRAVRFPDQWQHAGALIEDFPALDSTIFVHEGRWWLFCTSGEEGGEHKLYAWHAAALLGPWKPHCLNPLKCDVSSSRPAGRLFRVGGALYRPAQDCSRTYGGAIVINRITRLSPTDFAESPAGRISPAARSGYGAGLHTVCPFGSMTIIDGKKLVFDIRAPYLMARRAWSPRRADLGRTAELSMNAGMPQR